MTPIDIVFNLYRKLIHNKKDGIIPIQLRMRSIVGTVQDDPFDTFLGNELTESLPKLSIVHSGSLTSPDIVVREPGTSTILGIEVKKLIQNSRGQDPRGLTMDFNSNLPCGRTLIKFGDETLVIPNFYYFALLTPDSNAISTSILLDGDFLNYDLDLHKEAKTSNKSEYGHGPYGEGSVRHRSMYTYPNPLNSKLSVFANRHVVVLKKQEMEGRSELSNVTDIIIREDKYGNSFHYVVVQMPNTYTDYAAESANTSFSIDEIIKNKDVVTHKDIFAACKSRKQKDRTSYMVRISQ